MEAWMRALCCVVVWWDDDDDDFQNKLVMVARRRWRDDNESQTALQRRGEMGKDGEKAADSSCKQKKLRRSFFLYKIIFIWGFLHIKCFSWVQQCSMLCTFVYKIQQVIPSCRRLTLRLPIVPILLRSRQKQLQLYTYLMWIISS